MPAYAPSLADLHLAATDETPAPIAVPIILKR